MSKDRITPDTGLNEKIKDLEKELVGGRREFKGNMLIVVTAIAAFFSAFYLYTAAVGQFNPQTHRGLYILFTYVLCFLLYPFGKNSPKEQASPFDWFLVAATTVCIGYYIINYPNMAYRAGLIVPADIIFGWTLIVLSIEVTRRVVGLTIAIITVFFLVYCFFGPYFPGPLGHGGASFGRIGYYMFVTLEGIFGKVCDVFATFVFIFIIFGAFLELSGASKFFIDFPNALTGRYAGGPAKAAVIASGAMGSIAGSAVANVVTTGAFTIPLMKKNGFKPEVAAAVETCASCGGQLLPPIMGAGAFIISEFTGYSYIDVIKVAMIPGLLYFMCIMVVVHTEAKKAGLKGLSKEDLPPIGRTFKEGWYFTLPIIAIIALLITGFSPALAAVWSILSTVAVSMVKKDTRMTPKVIYSAFEKAGINSLTVGATTGSLGIIIGTIFLTGVGLKFSDLLITASGGMLPLTILMVAIASYVLGMGMTVTSSYIVLAVLAGPALTELGVSLMAAHLLIFWYSQDANITPPVCLAAYAGASIAGADPMKTGFKALIFAKPLYIIPFLFCYTPILLEGPTGEVLMTIASCTLGLIAITCAIQCWFLARLKIYEIGLLLVSSFTLFVPSLKTDIIGLSLFVLVAFLQTLRMREKTVVSAA